MLRTIAASSTLSLLLLAVAPAAPIPKAPPKQEYYFPTVVGDTWVLDKGAKQSVTAVERKDGAVFVTVTTDSDTVVGKPGGPPLRKNPQTYRVSEDGVDLLVPVNGGPKTTPFYLFKLPPGTGEEYTGNLGPIGNKATTHGPEDVVVKAGTFRAVRVVTESIDGKGALVERQTEWYAPRVGCIKRTWEVQVRNNSEMAKFTPGAGESLAPAGSRTTSAVR